MWFSIFVRSTVTACKYFFFLVFEWKKGNKQQNRWSFGIVFEIIIHYIACVQNGTVYFSIYPSLKRVFLSDFLFSFASMQKAAIERGGWGRVLVIQLRVHIHIQWYPIFQLFNEQKNGGKNTNRCHIFSSRTMKTLPLFQLKK